MFVFEDSTVVYAENFQNIINEFKLETPLKSFDSYGCRYAKDTHSKKDLDTQRYVDFKLNQTGKDTLSEYKRNKDFHDEQLNLLKSKFKEKYELYASIYCPYTGKLVKEVYAYIPGINFKSKNETFTYYHSGKTFKYKYKVITIGNVETPKMNFDRLEHYFSSEVLEVFKDEWSFEKTPNLDKKPRVKDVSEHFEVVKDSVTSALVYYPHTMSFEEKQVYYSKKMGRYYKYKKRIPIGSPDIKDFDLKLKDKLNN